MLAAAVVAGPVLPLVQVVCGMEKPMTESRPAASPAVHEAARHVADLPCPAHTTAMAGVDAMNSDEEDAANIRPAISLHDCATCDGGGDAYRTCCQSTDVAAAAALPVKYPEHMLDISSAAIQPPGAVDGPPARCAQSPPYTYAAPIPSPENHQALLATFLI